MGLDVACQPVTQPVVVVAKQKCLAVNIQPGIQKVAPTFLPSGANMWDAMLSACMWAPEAPDLLMCSLAD